MVIEFDQENVVVLADELGFGGIFEVAAPPLGHTEISIDGDWFVIRFIGAGGVLALQPGGDDREPTANGLIEGIVGIGRILAEKGGHGVRIVRFPCPDVGAQPGGNGFLGSATDGLEFSRAA